MNTCSAVLEMYQDPERRDQVLDPEAEFRRYREWSRSEEGVEAAQVERDERDQRYREEFASKIERERERWASPTVE
jgi:hypothetical protein